MGLPTISKAAAVLYERSFRVEKIGYNVFELLIFESKGDRESRTIYLTKKCGATKLYVKRKKADKRNCEISELPGPNDRNRALIFFYVV